jgi:hypothetical protein
MRSEVGKFSKRQCGGVDSCEEDVNVQVRLILPFERFKAIRDELYLPSGCQYYLSHRLKYHESCLAGKDSFPCGNIIRKCPKNEPLREPNRTGFFGQALTAGNLGAPTASVSATTKKPNERSTIRFGATANATFATNGSSPGCDTVGRYPSVMH